MTAGIKRVLQTVVLLFGYNNMSLTVMTLHLEGTVTVLAVWFIFPPLAPQLCGSDTAGARRVTSREKAQKPSEKKYQQEEQQFPANKAS